MVFVSFVFPNKITTYSLKYLCNLLGFFLQPRKGSGNRERKLETVKKIVATAKKCLKAVEK